MTLDPTTPVGRLVVDLPHAMPVLERHRIDYCCGGGRTLAEVCQRAGLDLATLEAEIEAAHPVEEPAVDWDGRALAELCDHIVTRYHRSLDEALPRLVGLARKVAAVHREKTEARLPVLLDLVERLHQDLQEHMRREEEVVFPWIRGGRGESAGAPIRVLTEDHLEVADLLQGLRAVTHDYRVPEEACGSWRALWTGLEALEHELHAHIHLENNVLFPRALA